MADGREHRVSGLQKLQDISRATRHVSQPPPAVLSCPQGWRRSERAQSRASTEIKAAPSGTQSPATIKHCCCSREEEQDPEHVGKPRTRLPGGCTQVGAPSNCFQAQGSGCWHTSCSGSTGALCSPISIFCTTSFWFRAVPRLTRAQRRGACLNPHCAPVLLGQRESTQELRAEAYSSLPAASRPAQ